MPPPLRKFTCTIHQEAWIDWNILVMAHSAEEAAQIAKFCWEDDAEMEESVINGLDFVMCEAGDCEEVSDAAETA